MGYFDNLKLDNWFKTVTYLGGIVVVLSLTVPMQVVSNEVMATIGVGAFLYGIGRWKNRKTFTKFVPGGKLSWEQRDTDLTGLFLEFSGVVAVLVAVGYILKTNFSVLG